SLCVAEESRQPARRDHIGPDWWQHHRAYPRQSDNLRVEAALADNARTVIRGEAGAGKSTLLSWLAVNAARGTFTSQLQGWNECVPFLVKLRDFANRPLPRGDALISEQSELECGPIPPEWVHRQLLSGLAILLVDGVDELPSGQRDKVRAWLRAQLGQYPDIKIVVTSRPTAITQKWLTRENFRSVVLEPMNPTDVQVFLQRWHRALLDSLPDPALLPCHPDDVPKHERSLMAQLQARAHLRALARNPLLCAMLCALNLDRKAKLPRDRLALYSAALDMLLERRDSDRGVAVGVQATPAEKLVLLRALAWWLNENSRTQMTRDQALDRLRDRLPGMPAIHEDAETLLEHLVQRSGVIRQPALGKIDFIHRTFQEFLAAKEAVDRDSIDLLIRNARSDLWRETVLMACAHANAEQRGRLLAGILNTADSANAKVARQLRLVATACKETATLVEPADVITRIDATIRDLLPPRHIRESRSLATVGEAVLDYLPATLDDLTPAQAAACFRTAALINGPRALDVLARYGGDPRYKVMRQAEECWRYFDPEHYA
ncbi:MAG TPA: NACHT domain-containing protein, partial [Pseudonocardiaceae bacterium]|nr:NACHT domain-containing protein [Pseudonocardiaceae bacterium]